METNRPSATAQDAAARILVSLVEADRVLRTAEAATAESKAAS